MADDSINPFYTTFGWRVTLEQLCLEAEAYKSLRTIRLIRRRQAKDNTSSGTFNFAAVPVEIFNEILLAVRQVALSDARQRYPFKKPVACPCKTQEDYWKIERLMSLWRERHPQPHNISAVARRELYLQESGTYLEKEGASHLRGCFELYFGIDRVTCGYRGWLECWSNLERPEVLQSSYLQEGTVSSSSLQARYPVGRVLLS